MKYNYFSKRNSKKKITTKIPHIESEDKYRNIFENSADAMMMIRGDYFFDFNEAAISMFGLDPKTKKSGIHPWMLSPKLQPDGKDSKLKANEMIKKAYDNGSNRFDWLHSRSNGETFYAEVSLTAIPFKGEKVLLVSLREITERKKAEEALIKSEKKLQAIFEHHFQLTGLIDTNGRLIAANKTALQYGNANESDVIDKYFWDGPWWNNSQRGFIKESIFKAVNGEFMRFETTHESPKGLRIIDFSLNPVIDNGKTIYVVPEGRDITDIRNTEDALKENEMRLRSLGDNLPGGMTYQIDMGTDLTKRNFTYLSAGIETLHELKVEDVLNDSSLLYRQVIEDDLPELIKKEEHAIKTSTTFTAEVRFKLPSGKVAWHWISSAPRKSVNGHTIWDGIEFDITERKKIEQSLLESEQQFRSIFDNAQAGIVISTVTGGEIIDCNKRLANIFGYETTELCKKEYQYDKHYLDKELYRKIIKNLNQSNSISNIETQIIKKNGTTAWVNISAKIHPDKKRMTSVLIDITELRRTQKQLEQSHRMRAVGQLAGGVAHDINNILAAIIGYADLTSIQFKDIENIQQYMNQILKAGDRAKNLVKQILTFSRQSHEENKPTKLKPIVEEVISLLNATLPSTIHIRSYLKKESKQVLVDSTKIHEIIMNLATNAVHAMDEKGDLSISLHQVKIKNCIYGILGKIPPAEYSVIEVEDTGSGIKESDILRIFEPFYTTKGLKKGTGLGLSVVYGVMKSSKGNIQVKSSSEKGSSFKLYFPITNEKIEDKATYNNPIPRGNETILYIDDEEILVNMVKKMLTALGYKVDTSTDSREALEKIEENINKYDLIITDQTMPHYSGLEIAKKILSIRKDLPIILCTGFSTKANKKTAEEAGCVDFITKPFSNYILAKKIRKALNKKNI